MSALTIHRMDAVSHLPTDRLLVPASRDGDQATALPGGLIFYVSNKLKTRARTVTVAWEGAGLTVQQSAVTVAPRQQMMIGPFGLDIGGALRPLTHEPLTVKLTYPRNRGLRVCALSPH